MMHVIMQTRKEFEAAFGRFRMNETEETCREALEVSKEYEELLIRAGYDITNPVLMDEGIIHRAIQVLKNYGHKFCVYENDKPCVLNGDDWKNNRFETLEDAVKYLRNWLGPQYVEALPEKVEVDVVYDIFDMKFVIRKEKM